MQNALRTVIAITVWLAATLAAADPSILVVKVHESKRGGQLWYTAGVADAATQTVDWSDSHKYDKGHMPMISVDGLTVVEVHQGLAKKNVMASIAAGRPCRCRGIR